MLALKRVLWIRCRLHLFLCVLRALRETIHNKFLSMSSAIPTAHNWSTFISRASEHWTDVGAAESNIYDKPRPLTSCRIATRMMRTSGLYATGNNRLLPTLRLRSKSLGLNSCWAQNGVNAATTTHQGQRCQLDAKFLGWLLNQHAMDLQMQTSLKLYMYVCICLYINKYSRVYIAI